MKVLTLAYRNGFPFVIPTGEVWDGITYVENGTALFSGPGSLPLYTPPRLKVGDGTIYPIPMMLDEAKGILSRVRKWDAVETLTPDDPMVSPTTTTATIYAGASEADVDDGAQNENDLYYKWGITASGAPLQGSLIVFNSFYQSGNISNASYPLSPGSAYPLSGSPDDEYQGNCVLARIGILPYFLYPLITFFIDDPTVIRGTSTLQKSGDVPTASGNNMPVVWDAATSTFSVNFSGGGYSYAFTLTPNEYWSYGGTYDPATGLRI